MFHRNLSYFVRSPISGCASHPPFYRQRCRKGCGGPARLRSPVPIGRRVPGLTARRSLRGGSRLSRPWALGGKHLPGLQDARGRGLGKNLAPGTSLPLRHPPSFFRAGRPLAERLPY